MTSAMHTPAASMRTRAQRGFTLVEMMIAVGLGLIVLAALTTFFVQTSQNRTELDRNSRQIENGRYALDQVREELMLAGFYSDVFAPGPPATTWTTPAACQTDPTAMGWLPGPYSGLTATNIPVPIFGYPTGVNAPSCVGNYKVGTDILVVRRFNTEPTTPGFQKANQVYVQQAECPTEMTSNSATPFLQGLGTATFNLHKLDCATLADLWRYREAVYYIRTCSICGSDNIPTLVRLELDSGVTNTVPLVEGIEDFRVDYGVDGPQGVAPQDGVPDSWTHCDPLTPCDATNQWGNVTAARIYVLARNLDPSPGYVDNKIYNMGLSGTVGPFNDSYKRHVYSAQVILVNRAEQREALLTQ